jgi:hypothetical protein
LRINVATDKMSVMPAGLAVAIAILAAGVGAPAAGQPTAGETTKASVPGDQRCENRANDKGDIVICAERSQGYRLNPDLIVAKRELRKGRGQKGPESFRDDSCTNVGPAGCMGAGAGVNLMGLALTAAEMAKRVAEGKEIGSMFQTTPTLDEYHFYLAAKQEREAREARQRAEALAAKTREEVEASKGRVDTEEGAPK